jgi:hypothetical protein
MTVYKQKVETMMRVEDYSDEDLIEELKERKYVVYKGKEMQFCITQLERM